MTFLYINFNFYLPIDKAKNKMFYESNINYKSNIFYKINIEIASFLNQLIKFI